MKCVVHKATLIITCLLVLPLFTSCKKSTSTSTSSSSGGSGTSSKNTLSSWATSNSAWAIRLDLNGANLTGSNFTLIVKFSDNSEIHCTSAQLSGTNASGTYNVGTCTDVTGSGMSHSTGASSFDTGGAGSYTNSGSSFSWCKNNSTCYTYY